MSETHPLMQEPRPVPLQVSDGVWSESIFDSIDFSRNAFKALLCPCVSAAQISTRLGGRYWAMLSFLAVLVGLNVAVVATNQTTLSIVAVGGDVISGVCLQAFNQLTGAAIPTTTSDDSMDDIGDNGDINDRSILNYDSDSFAALFTVPTLLIAIILSQLRTRVRKTFKIAGSELEDFLCSLYFPCCTLAQMSAQVEDPREDPCSFGPREAHTVLPGYRPS
ncbi:hypothetical protein AC1031_021383 [Aphanomyces cochlioides]|nr:hypothetical protein AC1031_021383 [Aphanomyces cochlioides]